MSRSLHSDQALLRTLTYVVFAAWLPIAPATGQSPANPLLMPDIDSTRTERLAFGGQRFQTPKGFTVEQVASHDLVGSVINLTFDHLGRPIVSSEGGGIRILLDENRDGIFETQKSFSEEVSTAMGLHFVGPGDLIVQSRGPDGPALYRLTDSDGDDASDTLETVMKSNGGIGEHGPHAIFTGSDGYWYVLYGNHAHPAEAGLPDSPSRDLREDFLLPRYVDPRGHATRIRAPGGTVHRVNPETGEWRQIASGFRNPFDMAIDMTGEIFLFDSDMEWDFRLPWFRPISVIHVTPGGDYGWRTGSSKMPRYYIDTLPSVDDVGRGSPVGVCFYHHTAYPEEFEGAFFMGDWSRGRIRVIFPKRAGATYTGETVDFVVGEPLNVTDVAVGPEGFLYFTTGGRNTRGGVYRVRYSDPRTPNYSRDPIQAVLNQPMPRSAWAQNAVTRTKTKLGDAWERELAKALFDTGLPPDQRLRTLEMLQTIGPKPSRKTLDKLLKDDDPLLRAGAVFLMGTHSYASVRSSLTKALTDEDPLVVRRACEALVRAGLNTEAKKVRALAERLFNLLDHPDRHVRYAARLAIMRVNKNHWQNRVLNDTVTARKRGALEGLLGLVLTPHTTGEAKAILAALERHGQAELDHDSLLDYLRVAQLVLIRDNPREQNPKRFESLTNLVGPPLLARFPTPDLRANRELQVLLAYMQAPETQQALLDYLTPDKSQEEQIHTVYALRTINKGWTADQRAQLVQWFETGRQLPGAASMEGYIQNLWESVLNILPENERLQAEETRMQADREVEERLLALITDDEPKIDSDMAQMGFEEVSAYLEYDPMAYSNGNIERGKRIFSRARCIDCHTFGTIGRGVGPDLSTVVSRFRRAEILESIMFPSKVISDQYKAVDLDLSDFTTVSGMLAEESDESLSIITIEGKRMDIPKSQIDKRRDSELSLMPEGLLKTMHLGELVDLITFLERGSELQ